MKNEKNMKMLESPWISTIYINIQNSHELMKVEKGSGSEKGEFLGVFGVFCTIFLAFLYFWCQTKTRGWYF